MHPYVSKVEKKYEYFWLKLMRFDLPILRCERVAS